MREIESCKKCKYFKEFYVPPLETYADQSNGYCCIALAPDGQVMWLGADKERAENDMCEMFMEKTVIKYKSPSGYSGALYGESSMSIYNPDGKEVLHTGFRRKEINSLEALKEQVDTYPEFEKMLQHHAAEIANDTEDDDNF